jgi:hypothetical protein
VKLLCRISIATSEVNIIIVEGWRINLFEETIN